MAGNRIIEGQTVIYIMIYLLHKNSEYRIYRSFLQIKSAKNITAKSDEEYKLSEIRTVVLRFISTSQFRKVQKDEAPDP